MTNLEIHKIYERYVRGWAAVSREERTTIVQEVLAPDIKYATPQHVSCRGKVFELIGVGTGLAHDTVKHIADDVFYFWHPRQDVRCGVSGGFGILPIQVCYSHRIISIWPLLNRSERLLGV